MASLPPPIPTAATRIREAATEGRVVFPAATAGFPRAAWRTTQASARSLNQKRRLLETERQIDVERARFTTQSYKATEGEPMPMRRAKMLLHLSQSLSITIGNDSGEGELIVGNRSLLPRMGVIAPEGAVAWIDRELDTLPTRPQDCFHITCEQIRELREEIFPYWRGKTLEDTVAARVPPHIQHAVKGRAFSLNQTDHAQGHILPDVELWLELGIEGLRTQVEVARCRHGGRVSRIDGMPAQPSRAGGAHDGAEIFYRAAALALDAAQTLIGRYAELAAELAASESNPQRASELARIAANCRHLVHHPPTTFYQALQAVWFLFVLLQIESNASSFSPGRFDQYMLPYLLHDLETGELTLPEAQEYLEALWLKFNTIVLLRSSSSARYFAGFPIGFNLAVGGQLADGCDATNILTYMCLRAQADVGLTQPNLSVRVHAGTPQELLEAAAFVISKGSGMPQIFNDEVIVDGQVNRGLPLAEARNYAIVGCVELSTPGKALGWSDASMFNLTRVLELTLFGGRDPRSGEQIGLPTPPLDQMQTFAELEAAYDQQLAHFVELMVAGCNTVDGIHAEVLPSPWLSLFVADCVERGLDVTAGGARYNFSGVQGVQIANVADSLAAVEQAVFAEGWLDGASLLEALRADYAGSEVLRQRLIHRVPKYGNDDDRVDRFARAWGDRYCALVEQYPTIRGGVYQPGFYTVSAHVPMGAHVGATPDGRHAGAPLADGGLSPTGGRDRRGATAVLHSVGKLNLKLASNGTLLNMKFLPSFFDGAQALSKFAELLRGFCTLHVPHVQFNVVSAATLRSAQANPDEFRSLVVRVAGYSAYFVELDKELQDEIIRRTEFDTV
jgi:formate C-acetyltransferase